MNSPDGTGSDRLTPYIVGFSLVGWPLVLVLALASGTTPSWQALVLAATALLSVWVPLRFQRDGDSHGVTVEEAVLVAILSIGAGPWAGALLGGAVTVGHLALGSRPAKIAFNGAQVGFSAAVASLAFAAVGTPGDVLSGRWFVAVTLAVVVYALTTMGAVTELFHRLENRPRRGLFLELWPMVATTTAANSVFGILLAFLAVADDRMLMTGILLTVAVQLGYRGYVRVVQDRSRTQLLQEATRSLVEVAGDPERLGEVLQHLVGLFGGRRAELVLRMNGRTRCLISHSDGTVHESVLVSGSASDEALMRGRAVLRAGNDGEVSAIAVPVVYEAEVLGSLAVFERHGFEPWTTIDLGLLSSLADEAAVAIRTVELFDEVSRERGKYEAESRKLSDVVNATSDGIVSLDSSGTVVMWNDAMTTITGVPAEESLGRSWFTVLRLRDASGHDLADQQINAITAVLAAGTPNNGLDVQILRRDGAWRWLRCSVSPVRRQNGLSGAVLVARDVTAQHEVDEMKADFLATVSHELRTPLTPLMGFVETLDRYGSDLSDEHRTLALDAMRSQLHRLGRLVDDLLVAANGDSGLQALTQSPVDLGELVGEVLAGVGPERGQRVSVVVSASPVVLADRAATERIVSELVDNALKHTAGDVRIDVGRQGDGATVSVQDAGAGIPAHEHDRIFDRFARLGDHLQRTQGPGLGLAIARNLAERLHGSLELQSEPGHGSVFTLTLPLTQSEPRTPVVRRTGAALTG